MSRSLESESALSLPDSASKAKLIIGIDFGTTFTGAAYVFQPDRKKLSVSELRNINENIRLIKQWPSRTGATMDKTPTRLAYINGNPGKWGGSVAPNDSPQFAHFKLGLQQRANRAYSQSDFATLGGYLTDHDWRNPLLPSKRAVDVTTDFLNCVVQYLLNDRFSKTFGNDFLQNQPISYIITVPAVWSEKAKELTRQAAVSAGIPSEEINLITEPEAAAHFCSILCKEVNLKRDDRFLVCDAGGGTVVSVTLKHLTCRTSSPTRSLRRHQSWKSSSVLKETALPVAPFT